MPIITKELALKIAEKLQARLVKTKGAHDIWAVWHSGKMIASFGIRRASRKDIGHDYIPGQIFVSPREAALLGHCPMSRQQWIEVLTEKGRIA